jgi:hypothetical protein
MGKNILQKHFEILWQEIIINITHKPKYFSQYDHHIEVRADERLPITETGYKSIFISNAEIEASGGIIKLIEYLLNEGADSIEWKNYIQDNRQKSLF